MRARAVVAMALVAGLAGCGDDGGDGGSGEESAALTAPEQPTEEDCAPDLLKTDVKPQSGAPKAGTYTYDMKGTRKDLNKAGVPVALPKAAPLLVTPTTKIGNVICFRTQIRYTEKQANTVTFAIRGGDFHIVGIDFFVAGQTLTFKPDKPIKAVDGSGALDWSGSFTGATRGQFRGTSLGRRSFTFEGKSERAIGIELQFKFNGELRGSNQQTIWISLERGTLYEQELEQVQNFGAQPIELKYKAKLKSYKAGS